MGVFWVAFFSKKGEVLIFYEFVNGPAAGGGVPPATGSFMLLVFPKMIVRDSTFSVADSSAKNPRRAFVLHTTCQNIEKVTLTK